MTACDCLCNCLTRTCVLPSGLASTRATNTHRLPCRSRLDERVAMALAAEGLTGDQQRGDEGGDSREEQLQFLMLEPHILA